MTDDSTFLSDDRVPSFEPGSGEEESPIVDPESDPYDDGLLLEEDSLEDWN